MGCGEKKDKSELIRIVRGTDGYSIDASGRKNGRGAYICRSADCLEKAFKRKGLERSFKERIPDDVYEKLKGEFESYGKQE